MIRSLVKSKNKVALLVSCCGILFCLEVEAEEPGTLPLDPLTVPVEGIRANVLLPVPVAPQAFLPTEEDPFRLEASFQDNFRLPEGKTLPMRAIRSRFLLGERVEPLIFRPNTTFQLSARGGFDTYMNRSREEEVFLLNSDLIFEEQLRWGLEVAETTVEFFNSTAVPLLGGVVSGLVEVGETFYQVDRNLRKRHLHLRYSNSQPTASYRIKF